MSVQSGLPAIPWSYESSDFGSVWLWHTPHFTVTVNGDNRSCYYQIADKSADPGGQPRTLVDGRAATFEQAELLIRGALGKAYDPTLGYGRFAGPLATTFPIATGVATDLGVFTGQEVDIVALNSDGSESSFTGIGRVEHYDFLLDIGTSTLRISPSYLVALRLTGQSAKVFTPPRVNRTVVGNTSGGCTGRPAFLGGFVDHSGPACPVHEI